ASDRHRLSDISKLMADLIYKVRWPSRRSREWAQERKWALDRVKEWGASGPDNKDWCVAMAHQVAKMLFYHSDDDSQQPYLQPAARAQAWADLQSWVEQYLS